MTLRMEYTPNGLLVKTIEGFDIYVVPMIFNYRIVLSKEGDEFGTLAGWCYFGRGYDVAQRALVAATVWESVLETDPQGFDKCAFDSREGALL